MADLKDGDVVVLKSGGPNMTVEGYPYGDDSSTVSCSWFVGDEERNGEFNEKALKKVEEAGE